MKNLKEIITTIIGTIILLVGIIVFILGLLNVITPLDIYTLFLIELLGWIFIRAKDSLLEDITLNLLKIKKK